MISALEALACLKEGNLRFASDSSSPSAITNQSQRDAVVERQQPIAIILGCSDARVPAEMVFDQGIGDLFVIRVAGNIVAPSQIGSVEYAAAQTGARLVVVLGHSNCGAVTATLDELARDTEHRSPNLRSIVDRIRPAVEELTTSEALDDRDALTRHAVRANIHASVDHLRHGSAILERLLETDGLEIVGAEYSLETGLVEFFDHVPGNDPTG